MVSKRKNLEEAFRETLANGRVMPSATVLTKLKRRLWLSDFFSVNPRKFNVIYAAVILGTGSLLFVIPSTKEGTEKLPTEATPADEKVLETPGTEKAANSKGAVGIPSGEVASIPSARFEIATEIGCAPLEVRFTDHSELAESYEWDFGNGEHSSARNPVAIYKDPGNYRATLTIKGKKGDLSSCRKEIKVLQSPKASIGLDIDRSDIGKKEIAFLNKSEGADTYFWDFGDDERSDLPEAKHTYADYNVYTVRLIAKAENGCSDTAYLVNRFIERDYRLAFPMNFRPNPYNEGADGFYESAGSHAAIFYPRNSSAREYKLVITAPNGLEIFSTTNIKQGWNGYIGGRIAPAGLYYFKATGVYPNGQAFSISGKFTVIVEDYF